MSTPILATKLYVQPSRPNVIQRTRLIEQLNRGLYHKLTIISAPAGFGKTTLVSDWVSNCKRPAAWLSLEQADDDPIRFLSYLVASLKTLSENIGENVLGLLESSQPVPFKSILTALLNEISHALDDFILVIDDYHTINSRLVDNALRFLIEHLPPQFHLVITTREDPQLPLAKLRAQDELTELRVKDLRFTKSESVEFLQKMTGQCLSMDDISALDKRTEGWIAGLQLAAISLQGRDDVSRFINSFTGSNRFVLDYLVEEVLQQLPENIQTFLIQTSLLERMCGSLCDAILDNSLLQGQQMLENLEQKNLFVIPLDDKCQWYRYHHLFSEMLQARAVKLQLNEISSLHQRASIWFENNNFATNAIQHALAAKNDKRTADLIELSWSEMRRDRFQNLQLLEWLDAIPDEIIQVRPVLSLGFARELLSVGKLDAAEDQLRVAEHWLQETTDKNLMVVVNEAEFLSLPASIANARAFLAQTRGDRTRAIRYAQKALALLPESDYETRSTTMTLLGLVYWSNGDLEAAYRIITESQSLILKENITTAISVAFVLADIRILQGRLFDAVSIYQRSLLLVKEYGDPKPQGTAHLYLGLSYVYCEWGKLEEARQYLQWAEESTEQVTLPDWQFRVCCAKAHIKLVERKLGDALDLYDEAEHVYYRSPLPDARPIAALKVQVWIRQRKLDQCMSWVREQNLSTENELSYMREFEHITLARLFIARYQNEAKTELIQKADELIERLLIAAEASGRKASKIEILILQALARQSQGDIKAALISIEQALKLAEPENNVQCFVVEGAVMEKLLIEVARQETMHNYVDKLLAAFNADDAKRKNKAVVTSGKKFGESLIEPLSQREIEVLQLIAEGLSNHDICQRLYLALSTVKGHNRIIFSKLQVQRRTEAVARARELGVI